MILRPPPHSSLSLRIAAYSPLPSGIWTVEKECAAAVVLCSRSESSSSGARESIVRVREREGRTKEGRKGGRKGGRYSEETVGTTLLTSSRFHVSSVGRCKRSTADTKVRPLDLLRSLRRSAGPPRPSFPSSSFPAPVLTPCSSTAPPPDHQYPAYTDTRRTFSRENIERVLEGISSPETSDY